MNRWMQPLVIVEGFFDAVKLHQNGCRKVVALMGSTMSAGQEELIRQHTNGQSQVIVMLDEDDAGRAGRDDIAARLARFCFVKVHQFEKPGTQTDFHQSGIHRNDKFPRSRRDEFPLPVLSHRRIVMKKDELPRECAQITKKRQEARCPFPQWP